MNTLFLAGGVAVVLALLGGSGFVMHQLREQTRLKARLLAIRRPNNTVADTRPQASSLAALLGAMGSSVTRSGLLPQKTLAQLEQTLVASGLRGNGALGVFVGTKVLLVLLMPLVTLVVAHHFELSPLARNVSIAVAALIGLLSPDWWVRRRHKRYLDAILLGLPDALDLMVICAEAGLGFEPAINRVAVEIRRAHPAISEEFSITASELRIVADSRAALKNMGLRTGLDSVKRMTSMLMQTMRYGTPLTDALRVLSAEMRQETLIRFETRAARLPVLLTIPMILFILPCIFLIVGGPAVIKVMSSFNL